MATYLKDRYHAIVPELLLELGKENSFAVPRIVKVSVNASVGKLVVSQGEKALEPIVKDLARICGQQPVLRKAKKAEAAFKVRQGMPLGVGMTLRGARAEDFIARLVLVALPRMRDFRGIPLKAIDEHGNLTIGIKEHTAFPETAESASGAPFGFEVTVVTTAKGPRDAELFFRKLGFPLQSA